MSEKISLMEKEIIKTLIIAPCHTAIIAYYPKENYVSIFDCKKSHLRGKNSSSIEGKLTAEVIFNRHLDFSSIGVNMRCSGCEVYPQGFNTSREFKPQS